MAKIKISVADYYVRTTYYPYMPETIYAALEKAYIAGQQYAEVDELEFKKMKNDKEGKDKETL